jgi:hypothetical protein
MGSHLFDNDGILGDHFQVGGSLAGPELKNSSSVLEVRNGADSAYALLRAANIAASGEQLVDLVNLLNLKGRIPNITFDFSGDPPGAGTNTNEFGFCHTTGGGRTAGDIVYDDGASILFIPSSVAMHLTTSSAITGTISLSANQLYALEGGSWVGKSVPSAVAGSAQTVEVTYSYSGGPFDSSASIPNGARVTRVTQRITTPINNSGTLTLSVNGSTPVVLINAETETNRSASDRIDRFLSSDIGADNTGVVRIAIGGSPGAGAGSIIVEYTSPNA